MAVPACSSRVFRWPVLLMAAALGWASVCGCARPAVSKDGQLVFTEREQRGASVITANGVEFIDKNDIPSPVLRKSAFERWRPPTGFLLPADGVLRQTSTPYPIQARGMVVVLRSSDVLVPAWGGEILLRLDALVPIEAHRAERQSVRAPTRIAIVLDDDGAGALPLAEAVIDALGARDRVLVVDSARGARLAVPLVPGSHRSLIEGATERALMQRSVGQRRARDLAAALALAKDGLGAKGAGPRRVLVFTDGLGIAIDRGAVARQARALAERGISLTAIAATDRVERDVLEPLGDDLHVGRDEQRLQAAEELLEPPAETVLSDVTLSFSSAPAPARLIEASSGEIAMTLEVDTLDLGDLYVGEARTEVVRLAVPAWTPGERYELMVAATYRDASGRWWRARRRIPMVYSDDIVQIAEQRHGDVIAYASALAMVRRLERVFLGSAVDRLGGLRGVVRWQAESMAVLAKERKDKSLAREAEVLGTLLGAIDE